jgi:hypothetical protein
VPALQTLASCSSGARSLSHFGGRVYPEMGNGGTGSTTFTVGVTYGSLQNLVARFSTNADVTSGLNDKLAAAAAAKNANARAGQLQAFANQVRAQTGKAFTAEQAQLLLDLAGALG